MTTAPFSSQFSSEFDAVPPPDVTPREGVAWRLWVRAGGQGIDVTGLTRFDFTIEVGRSDPDEQPDPGRGEFVVDVADSDRAWWASPGVAIWMDAITGQAGARVWRRAWTGTITEVRRRFRHDDTGPRNEVAISATGTLALLQRLKVPAGVAGNYPQQRDGERVWRLLRDLDVSASTSRPAAGHLVNDEFPDHVSRWDQTADTVEAPAWAVFNRATVMPDVLGSRQWVLGLHNYQTQDAHQHIGQWVQMRRHTPKMSAAVADFEELASMEGTPLVFTAAGTSAGQAKYATGPMSPTGTLAGGDSLGAGSSAVPDIATYQAWCQDVKDIAGEHIAWWEVWNEADSPQFFRGTPQDLAWMTWAAWDVWGDKLLSPSWTSGVLAVAGRMSGWYDGLGVQQTAAAFIDTYFDLIKQGAADRQVPVPFAAICYHGYGTGTTVQAAALQRLQRWEQFAAFTRSKSLNVALWDTEYNLRTGTGGGGFPDNLATAAAWQKSVRDVEKLGVARQYLYVWTDHDSAEGWVVDQMQINQDTPVIRQVFRDEVQRFLPVPWASRWLEVVVTLSLSRAAILIVNVAGNSGRQLWLAAGDNQAASVSMELPGDAYDPTVQVVAIPVDDIRSAVRWSGLDGTTTWADIPGGPTGPTWYPLPTDGSETTVTIHNVDVWRSGWDHGAVTLIARDPTENTDQTAGDHIAEVGAAARGVLWEQRDGALQWASQLTRVPWVAPSLDLPARYVRTGTESIQSLSGLVNDVTVAYGWSGMDDDDNPTPRPQVQVVDAASIGLFQGRFAATIDGPLADRPAAQAVARQVLHANARPRERLSELELIPLHLMDDATVSQLLTVQCGAVVEVESPPSGWVPSGGGGWRGFLEGWTLTGSAGVVTATLNISEYYENALT